MIIVVRGRNTHGDRFSTRLSSRNETPVSTPIYAVAGDRPVRPRDVRHYRTLAARFHEFRISPCLFRDPRVLAQARPRLSPRERRQAPPAVHLRLVQLPGRVPARWKCFPNTTVHLHHRRQAPVRGHPRLQLRHGGLARLGDRRDDAKRPRRARPTARRRPAAPPRRGPARGRSTVVDAWVCALSSPVSRVVLLSLDTDASRVPRETAAGRLPAALETLDGFHRAPSPAARRNAYADAGGAKRADSDSARTVARTTSSASLLARARMHPSWSYSETCRMPASAAQTSTRARPPGTATTKPRRGSFTTNAWPSGAGARRDRPTAFERPHLQRAAQPARTERQAPPRLEERQPGDAERAIDRGPPRGSRPQKHVKHHPPGARARRTTTPNTSPTTGARSRRAPSPESNGDAAASVADPRRRRPPRANEAVAAAKWNALYITLSSTRTDGASSGALSRATQARRRDEPRRWTRPEMRFALLFDIKCVGTRVLPLARAAADVHRRPPRVALEVRFASAIKFAAHAALVFRGRRRALPLLPSF